MTNNRISRRDALKGIASAAAVSLAPATAGAASRALARERSFDSGWRFLRGDAKGADQLEFNDSTWHALDLPHDWSIEDLPGAGSPFDKEASAGKASTGWVVGGVGWYRKLFNAQAIPTDRRVELRFDGVYMDADVWVNGHHMGSHPYGYTGFAFDIADHITRENDNLVAVRVRNQGQNSRWYSGSGIYRHVWLTVTNAVHVPLWGVSVVTPEVSPSSATVKVAVKVANLGNTARDVSVRVRIVDPSGAAAGAAETVRTVVGGAGAEVEQNLTLSKPQLWSAASPALYRAEVELAVAGKTVDETAVAFGVRAIEMDAQRGLRINGEAVKLKGGCVHHDNGVLGAAAIDRADQRRIELLKAAGFNAVRCAHNPPSPAFLDACDRLGMYVIDEAFDMWEEPKNPEDYHRFFNEWWQRDLDSMLLRDRNHPSVIVWSIGNEIKERADPEGVVIAKKLAAEVRRLDPTRPVTAAVCEFWEPGPKHTWTDSDAAFAPLGLAGYNYEWREYEPDHGRHPERIIAGTESFAVEAFENWRLVEKHPWVIGDFVWTAMDYLGESGIGHTRLSGDPPETLEPYPWFNAWCGDIDLIGQKKPQSYFRDVVWGNSKLEMAVARPIPAGRREELSRWGWPDELRSWTWPGSEGKPLKVRLYSSGGEVRLLLNGKEIGRKPVSLDTRLTAEFEVPYEPGELRALAYSGGNEVGRLHFRTAGPPARLRLRTDRETIRGTRNDLAYVTVEVLDREGILVPDATLPVAFHVTGAGELAAVGSANPHDMASFRKPMRNTFQGRCLAVLRPLRAEGAISLSAEAPGLGAAGVLIRLT